MKIFHISPASADYSVTGDSYETPVYDLYDNDFYRNYCTTKSAYGLNLMGDRTWTGLDLIDASTTDSGYMDDTDRFVDTSARVVVAAPVFTMADMAKAYGMGATIDVYLSDIEDFPDDWALYQTVEVNEDFTIPNADRYIRFAVNLTNPNGYDFNPASPPFKLAVRVEIDKPLMAPLYERTRYALDKLPEWMEMREIDNIPTEFGLATPVSVGGNLVNSVMGEWLDKIADDLSYLNLQTFITSVDLNQVDWIYEYELSANQDGAIDITWMSRVVDPTTGNELAQATDLDEFYQALATEDIYFWQEEEGLLFTRKAYDSLRVYRGTIYDPVDIRTPRHIWNPVDDIAVLVDLPRLHLETNEHFQKRILDVYINRPGAGIESFKNALRRELDIWHVYGSTPDSFYEGATPEVLEMSDLETDSAYTTANGMPTIKFAKLVEKLAAEYPTTWGRFYWGKAIWDTAGEDFVGYKTLPSQFDATPATDTAAGIGDFSDLMVYKPDEYTGPHQFSTSITLRGKHKNVIEESRPEVTALLELRASCDVVEYQNPVEPQWITVLVEAPDKLLYIYKLLEPKNDTSFTVEGPTPNSYARLDVFEPDGSVRTDLDWIDAESDDLWDGLNGPHVTEIENLILVLGKYNPLTEVLTDEPDHDAVKAWWSANSVDVDGNPIEVLEYGHNEFMYAEVLETATPETATPSSNWSMPSVYMSSNTVDVGEGTWQSYTQIQEIKLNGGPNNSAIDFDLKIPDFEWPIAAIMADTPNKKCQIKQIAQPYTFDASGNKVDLPYNTLALDGNNTWDGTHSKFINVAPESTDAQLLVYDSFNRPDSDWVGFTDPTGTDGTPIFGSVPWVYSESPSSAPLQIVGGWATGDDDPESSNSAVIYTDAKPGYAGGSYVDDPEIRVRSHVDVSDSESSVIFVLRAEFSGSEDDPGDFVGVIVDSTNVLLFESSETATPASYAQVSHAFGDDFDVKIDVVGDVVAVYLENTLVLAYTYDEDLWDNKVFGVGVFNKARVEYYSLEGMTNQAPEAQTVTFSTVDNGSYPLDSWGWELFERKYQGDTLIDGIVDENGPWRNGAQPAAPSKNYVWKVMNLTRADFDVPEDPDWIPTWIGVKTAKGAAAVRTWLDTNVIDPVNADDGIVYPDTAISEIYDEDEDEYGFEPIVIKARLRPEVDSHWYPQVNSGFYYFDGEEHYLYADRKDELIESATPTLSGQPRQGAPIVLRTTQRQLLTADSFNRPDDTDLGYTDGDGLLDPIEWDETVFNIEDGHIVASGGGAAFVDIGSYKDSYEMSYRPIETDQFVDAIAVLNGQGTDAYLLGIAKNVQSSIELATPDSTHSYRVLLYKMVSTVLSEVAGFMVDTFPSKVKAVVLGGKISVYADGSLLFTWTDTSPLTGSQVGFVGVDSKSPVDDFAVYTTDDDFEPVEFRQVSFYDDDNGLTLFNTETLNGNGTNILYTAYEDITSITVTDLINGDTVSGLSTDTNRIALPFTTNRTHAYEVTYSLRDSFYLYMHTGGLNLGSETKLVLSDLPEDMLVATYEESIYNPAAVIDLPLSPTSTRIEEGFIFLSETEYELGRIIASMSGSTMMSQPTDNDVNLTGNDYLLFNIKSVDTFGNPKANQRLRITGVTFGRASAEYVVTNADGIATVTIVALPTATPSTTGSFTITAPGLSVPVSFLIQPSLPERGIVVAAPSAEEIPADGAGKIYIYGRAFNSSHQPLASQNITYRRARSLYEAFTSAAVQGPVVTNSNGEFEIGPFTASDPDNPGFWFVVVETQDGSAGDVVFWHEYPMTAYGIDDLSGLPKPDIQMATPISAIPPYAHNPIFPYSYDEDVVPSATPTSPYWLPPQWYKLDWFLQYQLGIISDEERYELPAGYEEEAHPPYRL